jgi:hypothetical protein
MKRQAMMGVTYALNRMGPRPDLLYDDDEWLLLAFERSSRMASLADSVEEDEEAHGVLRREILRRLKLPAVSPA